MSLLYSFSSMMLLSIAETTFSVFSSCISVSLSNAGLSFKPVQMLILSLASLLLCFVLAVFVPAVVVQYCKSVSISFASLCENIIIRSPCWCLEDQDQLYPRAQSSLWLSPLQEEGLQTLLFRWNKLNCLFHWNWKWVVLFVHRRCLWLLCSCFVVSD